MASSRSGSSHHKGIPLTVGGKYKLLKKIGAGSFGEIYLCGVSGTTEEYAVKMEPLNSKMPQLMYECKLYQHLSGNIGIPLIKYHGVEGSYNVMVMELLGKSLEDLIHRDIKPDNFLMGKGKKKGIVYMIDLGLSKRYRDANYHQHIPFREGKGLTGTVRYASVNSHLGYEQSRRDDLEAIGYVLVYFMTGQLPWQGLKIESRTKKFQAICDLKRNITPEQLCKNIPNEFALYLKYVKGLSFDQAPDYFYLRRIFQTLFLKNRFAQDYIYDWTVTDAQGQQTVETVQKPIIQPLPPQVQQQIQKQNEADKDKNIEKDLQLKKQSQLNISSNKKQQQQQQQQQQTTENNPKQIHNTDDQSTSDDDGQSSDSSQNSNDESIDSEQKRINLEKERIEKEKQIERQRIKMQLLQQQKEFNSKPIFKKAQVSSPQDVHRSSTPIIPLVNTDFVDPSTIQGQVNNSAVKDLTSITIGVNKSVFSNEIKSPHTNVRVSNMNKNQNQNQIISSHISLGKNENYTNLNENTDNNQQQQQQQQQQAQSAAFPFGVPKSARSPPMVLQSPQPIMGQKSRDQLLKIQQMDSHQQMQHLQQNNPLQQQQQQQQQLQSSMYAPQATYTSTTSSSSTPTFSQPQSRNASVSGFSVNTNAANYASRATTPFQMPEESTPPPNQPAVSPVSMIIPRNAGNTDSQMAVIAEQEDENGNRIMTNGQQGLNSQFDSQNMNQTGDNNQINSTGNNNNNNNNPNQNSLIRSQQAHTVSHTRQHSGGAGNNNNQFNKPGQQQAGSRTQLNQQQQQQQLLNQNFNGGKIVGGQVIPLALGESPSVRSLESKNQQKQVNGGNTKIQGFQIPSQVTRKSKDNTNNPSNQNQNQNQNQTQNQRVISSRQQGGLQQQQQQQQQQNNNQNKNVVFSSVSQDKQFIGSSNLQTSSQIQTSQYQHNQQQPTQIPVTKTSKQQQSLQVPHQSPDNSNSPRLQTITNSGQNIVQSSLSPRIGSSGSGQLSSERPFRQVTNSRIPSPQGSFDPSNANANVQQSSGVNRNSKSPNTNTNTNNPSSSSSQTQSQQQQQSHQGIQKATQQQGMFVKGKQGSIQAGQKK
ncbi:MAG: putative Casein kinase I [Streblomastix strix]|uniref:non-specific serine/threonine protein kinase n=1 Tax=Streblomastix strix TaxID=222440 RepID=A0A5J4WBX9_9EUKA|nr:MAG: putative Casein kinase I [Streblomastix strix]